MLTSIRRRLAAVTGAAALLAGAGCGAESPRAVPEAAAGPPTSSSSPAAAGTNAAPSAPPSRTARPVKTAAAPSPTRSAGTKPKRSRPPSTTEAAPAGLRITNLSLTVPDENGFGRPVKGVHQEGCGPPTGVTVGYTVTVPGARFRETWYEYEVDAPAPLRGRSDSYEMVVRGDRTSVKTVIGPLARKPANAAGGTLTLTVVVVDNTSGKRVTARLAATLLPCT